MVRDLIEPPHTSPGEAKRIRDRAAQLQRRLLSQHEIRVDLVIDARHPGGVIRMLQVATVGGAADVVIDLSIEQARAASDLLLIFASQLERAAHQVPR
jgi:hypothetical protein